MSRPEANVTRSRRLWLPEMEGVMAPWYDRQRGTAANLRAYQKQASQLTAGLKPGATVLEVAPGPGYLAIEIARLGNLRVTGLDISHTMVELATGHARQAGMSVDFRHGDVVAMPFGPEFFDLIVCQAAFKNFRQPVAALDEMYRVLRGGGTAVIQDLRRDTSGAEIDDEVRRQALSGISAFITRQILRGLRRRALSSAEFERVVAASLFRSGDMRFDGIGLELRLRKPVAA
jgi:ubiquinone/menaquinone biosynthesis C-methylase UbiE